jgi:hypothetical protein
MVKNKNSKPKHKYTKAEIIVGTVLLFGLIGFVNNFIGSTSKVETNQVQEAKPEVESTQEEIMKCQSALKEDIDNINSGMSRSNYSVSNAFMDNLEDSEISEIQSIFPSYSSPIIIAGRIEGGSIDYVKGSEAQADYVIGIWAIQKSDAGGARITALDLNARNYSEWGSAASDDSPAAKLREKLYEFSLNTNALPCLAPLINSTEVKPEPKVDTSSNETTGQENAKKSAKNYLDYTAFSRSGLINQLEYEGFSTEEATYGVDALDTDWNEQAAKSAKNYLDYTAFSRSGLINQLEYEGFSTEEATYGAGANGY